MRHFEILQLSINKWSSNFQSRIDYIHFTMNFNVWFIFTQTNQIDQNEITHQTSSHKFVRDHNKNFKIQKFMIKWKRVTILHCNKSSFYIYFYDDNDVINSIFSSFFIEFVRNDNEHSLIKQMRVNLKNIIIEHDKLSSFYIYFFDENIDFDNVINLNYITLESTFESRSRSQQQIKLFNIFLTSFFRAFDKIFITHRIIKVFVVSFSKQKQWHFRRLITRSCHFDKLFFFDHLFDDIIKQSQKFQISMNIAEFKQILIDFSLQLKCF